MKSLLPLLAAICYLFLYVTPVCAQTDSLSAEAKIPEPAPPLPSENLVVSAFESTELEASQVNAYTHTPFVGTFLIGEWEKVTKHYKAVVRFDDESCRWEKYFLDSDSKMEQSDMNYAFMQDSILLKGRGLDDSKSSFWIRKLTPDSLVLQNPENFEYHVFTRKTTDMPALPPVQHSFRAVNRKLSCMADENTTSDNYNACLHIGALDLTWSLDSFEAVFGNPIRFVQSKSNPELGKHVFALKPFQGTQPELIVTHNSKIDKIIEIQIRGFGTVENLDLAGIRLGDYLTLVEQLLGKPTEKMYDNETITTKWLYSPYPVAFEFKNKYVNGIKIFVREEGEQ